MLNEAHCISEWGYNFRPDYLKLPHYRQSLNIPQVLTATPALISDMQHKFAIPPENLVVTDFYRPNLHLQVLPVTESGKIAVLTELIADDPRLATIIYVTLQYSAEWVAPWPIAPSWSGPGVSWSPAPLRTASPGPYPVPVVVL